MKVAWLIDPESRTWYWAVISQLFSYEEAISICNIPLSLNGAYDKLSWWPTRNGGAFGNSIFLGHFIWKVCYDILPTRLNLVKRKFSDQVMCPICNIENESLIHILCECPAATDVWGETRSPLRKWRATASSFMELWTEILINTPIKTQELCALICCNLWLRRNAFIFENVFTNPRQVLESALQQLESFQSASLHVVTEYQQQNSKQRPAARQWTKPKENHVKVNCDAALNDSRQTTGLGGLFQNSDGEILVSFSSNIDSTIQSALAETLALRKAMLLCWELQFHKALFEGDCLKVITDASSSKTVGDELYPIIHDIRTMLQHSPGWSIQFCHREANRAAHHLAKIAYNFSEERVWMEECPSPIDVIVLEEKLCNSAMFE